MEKSPRPWSEQHVEIIRDFKKIVESFFGDGSLELEPADRARLALTKIEELARLHPHVKKLLAAVSTSIEPVSPEGVRDPKAPVARAFLLGTFTGAYIGGQRFPSQSWNDIAENFRGLKAYDDKPGRSEIKVEDDFHIKHIEQNQLLEGALGDWDELVKEDNGYTAALKPIAEGLGSSEADEDKWNNITSAYFAGVGFFYSAIKRADEGKERQRRDKESVVDSWDYAHLQLMNNLPPDA
jgi:hypothetical protein